MHHSNQLAEEYLKRADCILLGQLTYVDSHSHALMIDLNLVTEIKRAKNDRVCACLEVHNDVPIDSRLPGNHELFAKIVGDALLYLVLLVYRVEIG